MILGLALMLAAADPLDVYGDWVIPPDDPGGPDRGVVTIAQEGGAPVGRITKVGEAYKDDPEAADALGLTILWGFEADDDKWKGGRILDPEADKRYRSKIKREGDTLSVKGCVAFICREQVWLPAPAGVADAP